MARSTNIYVVCGKGSGMPLATFTVKKECKQWLEKHCQPGHGWVNPTVLRFGDGVGQTPWKGVDVTRDLVPEPINNPPL